MRNVRVSTDRGRVAPASLFAKWVWSAVLAASLLGATGCAERPKGVLGTVAETSPTASQVQMMVVTMRSRASNPGELFTGERGLKPASSFIVE